MLVALFGRCNVLRAVCRSSLPSCSAAKQTRTVTTIPKWKYHIRFDATVGRKRPDRDVLERFKRLNNGLWIRGERGRTKQRYLRTEQWKEDSMKIYTCTPLECQMLDALVTPFWLRPRYYVDDPYEFYHKRHNLPPNTPRVDDKGKLKHERKKILLDDLTADKYFPR